jgi:Zn-finger nucleic acid-binding protein
MKCPSCDVAMNLAERQGVEIDYCPQCRGVWLDRGELDKIIERTIVSESRPPAAVAQRYRYDDHYEHNGHNEHGAEHHGYKYHKRKGFLKDLFDF